MFHPLWETDHRSYRVSACSKFKVNKFMDNKKVYLYGVCYTLRREFNEKAKSYLKNLRVLDNNARTPILEQSMQLGSTSRQILRVLFPEMK